MVAEDFLKEVTDSFYSALYSDFKEFEYTTLDIKDKKTQIKKKRKVEKRDLKRIFVFEQTWGGTALGFGGLNCNVITKAYVVCIEGPAMDFLVYFGGRLAYHIEKPNQAFFEDVKKYQMVDTKDGKNKYEKNDK